MKLKTLELKFRILEISWTKSDWYRQNIDKIWLFWGFFERKKFGLILLNLAIFKTSFGFVHAQKPTNPDRFVNSEMNFEIRNDLCNEVRNITVKS